jgi:hypothetical protein
VKRRRQSPGPRSEPRTTRAKYDCLDVLTGDEAQIVLKDLLSSRPDLISDARRAANALLASVSLVDVAADVFDALQGLDLDDLDAGPRPGPSGDFKQWPMLFGSLFVIPDSRIWNDSGALAANARCSRTPRSLLAPVRSAGVAVTILQSRLIPRPIQWRSEGAPQEERTRREEKRDQRR